MSEASIHAMAPLGLAAADHIMPRDLPVSRLRDRLIADGAILDLAVKIDA